MECTGTIQTVRMIQWQIPLLHILELFFTKRMCLQILRIFKKSFFFKFVTYMLHHAFKCQTIIHSKTFGNKIFVSFHGNLFFAKFQNIPALICN